MTSTDLAVRSPLVERISAISSIHPAAPAITAAAGSLRYRDLEDLRIAWSADLREKQARPGSIVALIVRDPLFLAPAFLAARSAGLVPLLIDPHQPASRRASVLTAARPALTMQVRETPTYEPTTETPLTVDPSAGYLGFTSGTQGSPKGIVSNEHGALRFVDWEIETLGLRPGTRVALLSPPTFEVVIRELFVALCSGGELLAARPTVRIDPAAVVDWLAEEGAELVHAVPSLSTRWVKASRGRQLPQLRWTVFAGEPLHSAQVLDWRRTAPSTDVINLYGPSETTLAKFFYRVPNPPHPGLQPVGRPMPGTRLLTSAPPNEPFPVAIETPHGSFGYLPGTAPPADDAALTRNSGVTTFATKDLGMLTPDGNLVITGRSDSRVKRHGVFVDLTGIEQAATASPDVRLACCLQAADGTLVLFAETTTAEAHLSRQLRRELGPSAPDKVITLPRMPLSPNGKIDRRALAASENGARP
ncbi:hypothetical protein GCM10022254_55530 [Actinomadura meridiana]|uniref:AMP-dependent synthetase/ligase domain-containing protein n=1 Tax=Actinomadura meridiana TaxID=559626 RepID=A0ABP8CGB2_9ACTN